MAYLHTMLEWREPLQCLENFEREFQSILAVASLDGQLATLSIMQRINKPNDPVQVLIGSMDPMSRYLFIMLQFQKQTLIYFE